jgi:hypothetical protein
MKRSDAIELFKALQAYLQRFPNATFKIGRKKVVGGGQCSPSSPFRFDCGAY